MNTKHISLAFAAAAALLAGCAKNPIEEAKSSGQLTDLELSHVGSTEVKSVINGTEFPQTGEIGLFLFTDEAATTPYGDTGYTNIKYAYNSTKGRWTASPSIKVGGTPGYLYGYYPYDSEATDVKAIPVSSSLNGDDVMYASKQAEPITDATAANTAITMNHALARISITIVNKGYTGDAKLSKIKFYGAEIAPTGTLNAIDGKITAEKNEVSLDVTGEAQTITAAGSTYECLLVPSNVETNRQAVTLTLTIDGIAKEATLSGDDNGVIFAQGTKSNITIGLSNSGISVQTVSVEDWNVVEVGGHKVTVSVDESQVPVNDILTRAYCDGDFVRIVGVSQSGNSLVCTITGDATCVRTKYGNFYIFTISDITSDINASIGYQRVESISISRTSANPAKGWDFTLTASVFPDDAINKAVVWSSDDETIVKVDNYGHVTAIEEGEATVTAAATDGSGVTATCTVTVGPAAAVLPHAFSVSSTKQVYFTKGNLWVNVGWMTASRPDPAAIHFESNQWEFSDIFEYSGSHISYFRWGEEIYFSANVWSGTLHTKYLFCDENHKMSIDNSGEIYYALSTEEWQYLFNNRQNASKKYGYATVGNVQGIILLPDFFTDPKTNKGSNSFVPESVGNWGANEYTTGGNWEAMENAGAVFLPAAGYVSESVVYDAGKSGGYWSSTQFQSPSYSSSYTRAYSLLFDNNSFSSGTDIGYTRGYSIRLVTDLQ